MKSNRILVGLTGAMSLAFAAGAACPPEECVVNGQRLRSTGFLHSGVQVQGQPLSGRFVVRQGQPLVADRFVTVAGQPLTSDRFITVQGRSLPAGQFVTVEGQPLVADRFMTVEGQPLMSDQFVAVDGQPLTVALAEPTRVAGRFVTIADAQPEGRAKVRTRVVEKSDSGEDSRYVIVKDGETISVTMKDGKVNVDHNGKKYPADRVQKEGGKIKLLAPDGSVAHEFSFEDDGGVAVQGQPTARSFTIKGDGENGFQAMALDKVEPPKAMIGVQLGEPDGLLLGHFGLDAGEATLVSGVYEDLPAGKAGIEPYDIIIAVNGDKPAGQGEVREALRGKDAGDSVKLTIIHRGEKKDVKVTLVKYDQEALEGSKLNAVEHDAMTFGYANPQGGEATFVVPGLGQLRNIPGQDAEHWKQFAEEWRARAMQGEDGEGVRALRIEPPAPAQAPGRASAPDARLKQMDERLERLEKMIERLVERQNRGGAGGG